MRNHLNGYSYTQEVSPEQLAHMLDWSLRWHRRNETATFSLVLIDFHDPSALGNSLGAAYAMDLVRRVGREISSVLRSTDLFCRVRVSSFVVLLPQGSPSIVLNKIEPVLAVARADGLDASQMHIAKIAVPDDLVSEKTAVDLFDRLYAR